jgi:uncharacterized protein (TIGR02996 family)
MGYTTTFRGWFDCYRVEGPVFAEFLKAIYRGDQTALRAFADWLIDQGDPRGEKVSRRAARWNNATPAFWRLFGLRPEHAAYLMTFSRTRRVRRDPAKAARLPDPVREAVGLPLGEEAAYFVGGRGFMGQDDDESVLSHNYPPKGQPGLWCQWEPNKDSTAIVWSGAEKFYDYVEWLRYLIEHFLQPWGYVLNGDVKWEGEIAEDRGVITVKDNEVRTARR